MWARKAVKFGYKWHLGDGKSILFLEDIWFYNSPLATRFWDFYYKKNKIIMTSGMKAIKYYFRRAFLNELICQWFELEGIVSLLSSLNQEIV